MRHEKINLNEVTTTFILRDSSGKIKKQWESNTLGRFIKYQVKGITGNYVEELKTQNTITNVGHAVANGLMSNQGAYGFAIFMAIGIGTQSAAGATALNSEIVTNGGQRASGTASRTTTSVTNDTTSLTHTWTFTGSFAITEEGILTASSVGSLLAYQTFAAINVVSGDTLAVTHTYQT